MRTDESLSDENSEIKEEIDKMYVYETLINVASIKEEPCDTGNEQAGIYKLVGVKDENIDDLLVARETKLMTDSKSRQDIIENYVGIKDENIDDLKAEAQETNPIIECTDDRRLIFGRRCIKQEPCDMENELGTFHKHPDIKHEIIEDSTIIYNYVGIKDVVIDDLTVVAQKTEVVADCTDDKKNVIGGGYLKQEPYDTESESGSFHKQANIKDEIIEDSTAILVQEIIPTSNIKGNYLTRCEGCGDEYDLYCPKCPMLIRIFNGDNPKHNNVSRTLPKGFIDICKTPNGVGIVALTAIPKGVVFGPFEGLNSIKDGEISKWKMRNEELAYTKDPKWLNWMQYVRRADRSKRRNLTPFQHRDALYYRSDHHISAGDELLMCWDSGSEGNGIRGTEDSYWTPPICERLDETYACTLCCVGYKSIRHLAGHNSRCPEKRNRGDFCKENIQCAFCKIYLDEKEYLDYHMDRCCKIDRVKYVAALSSPEDIDKPEVRDKYKCSLCEYSNSQRDKYEVHQLTHTDLRMYKCPKCPHRARTNWKLQRHLLTHANRKRSRFECRLCGERFTRWDLFATHQKRAHLVSVYKCDKCAFETAIAQNLGRHLATHKDAKRYDCKTCGKLYQTKDTLYEHVRNLHNERRTKYKCPKCQFESFYWSSLKDHLLAVHSGVKRFKCPRCAFKTSYKKIIERHLRYHVDREVSESFEYERHEGVKPFGCTLCSYRATRKDNLKQHMLTHTDNKPFECDVCAQTFKNNSALKKHVERMHSEAGKCIEKDVYKCYKCEYRTYRPGDFNQHLAKAHEDVIPFPCALCPYKTRTSSKLQRHQAVHTDDKAFKCEICPKAFKQKESLTNHVRNIHSVREYKCPQCPFETAYKTNLKYHVNAHDKNGLFQCSKCEFNTYNKKSFGRHQIRHERTKKYAWVD